MTTAEEAYQDSLAALAARDTTAKAPRPVRPLTVVPDDMPPDDMPPDDMPPDDVPFGSDLSDYPVGVEIEHRSVDAIIADEVSAAQAAERAPWRRLVPFGEILDAIGPITYAADPLAAYGYVSLLAGLPKDGKSTLTGNIVQARDTGGLFLGRPVPKGPTILYTEERGTSLKRKFAGLSSLYGMTHQMAAKTAKGGLWEALVKELNGVLADVGEIGPFLVVIDTFSTWGQIVSENDPGEITQKLNELGDVAATHNAAILLIDHTRKDSDGNITNSVRGSGAKVANVDIFAVLSDNSNGKDTDRVLTVRGREGVLPPTTLNFDLETGIYTRPDTLFEKIAVHEAKANALPFDGPGLTLIELRALWGGMAEKRTETLVNELVTEGLVRREKVLEGRAYKLRHWSARGKTSAQVPDEDIPFE